MKRLTLTHRVENIELDNIKNSHRFKPSLFDYIVKVIKVIKHR
jgi:hypothetical protein